MTDSTAREHIGVGALEAERAKLLSEFDVARAQTDDDSVKTEHGVSAEALFRSFLAQFLPKKFGVTKGYIITPELAYAGPLEEWDVIIYDALESPVLFLRSSRDEAQHAGKRGIPVEYVRGVVEVKATFTKKMATDATNKLLKLRQFLRPQGVTQEYGRSYLPQLFRAFAVFFETKVASSTEYSQALAALGPFWQTNPMMQFDSALIIRGHTCPEYSSAVGLSMIGGPAALDVYPPWCEVSPLLDPGFVENAKTVVSSWGFGPNEFWTFMVEMVHALNGEGGDYGATPSGLTGGYGRRANGHEKRRLFPKVEQD